MQVSLEKLNNIECKLTIIVPAEQVEGLYEKKIDQYCRTTNLKGFRPGKAPLSLIVQKFGPDARHEAISEVIQNSLEQALEQEKLTPVGLPRIEPKAIVPNQPLEYVALFEILPEIENVNFAMDQIEKLVVDISDEDVTRTLEQIKRQFTKWRKVTRAAQDKDRVVVDYYPIFEGGAEKDRNTKDVSIEIGAKKMIPGFEEGLIGSKISDQITLSLKYPDTVADQEKAGKPIDFVVTIKEIFEAESPELSESFIQKLGVKSGKEEDLYAQIRQSLEQERDQLVKEKLKEQLFQKILDLNPIDVPNALVDHEAARIHNEIYPKDHDHSAHSKDELTQFQTIAKKRVALGLLISAIAKQSQISADVTRVTKRIADIASAYEHPQQVVEYLSKQEQRRSIEAQILEDQIMEKLMDGLPIVEKQLSYAELKGIRI